MSAREDIHQIIRSVTAKASGGRTEYVFGAGDRKCKVVVFDVHNASPDLQQIWSIEFYVPSDATINNNIIKLFNNTLSTGRYDSRVTSSGNKILAQTNRRPEEDTLSDLCHYAGFAYAKTMRYGDMYMQAHNFSRECADNVNVSYYPKKAEIALDEEYLIDSDLFVVWADKKLQSLEDIIVIPSNKGDIIMALTVGNQYVCGYGSVDGGSIRWIADVVSAYPNWALFDLVKNK